MRRNIMKIAAVAALAVALTACKGDDDDDDVVMLALLYLADQTSGNCVTITKDDGAHPGAGAGDGKPTYTAIGTTKPKAACSGSYNVAVIVNNAEAVVNSVKASYQAAKDKADTAGSNCTGANQTSASIQTVIDGVTVLKVEQTLAGIPAGGNNIGSYCATNGTGWNLNPLALGGSTVSTDPAYFGKTVYACASEQAKEKLLSGLSVNNYSTIAGSVATDMATSLIFKQKTAAVSASNFNWTADAAAKGRLINVTELTTAGKSGAALIAFTTANLINLGSIILAPAAATTARACAKAILANESTEAQGIAAALHDFNIANLTFFAGAATGTVTGDIITTAQAAEVKEVLFSSLSCKYGDFDEENTGNKTTVGTETNVKNIGTCPTTYPKI
ncbi:lipoprotein LipL36 [Leptospira noguchii]|uniref:lipoprotein LipL36 n=1 Tax=Leptospira noguchii TaxID=28182 RepID=UPI0003284309|nr:lipoprotein LipL36 [Leptospira noguchii]EMS83582.1 putative lipoprotein [Leptospira noguchii str. Hook]